NSSYPLSLHDALPIYLPEAYKNEGRNGFSVFTPRRYLLYALLPAKPQLQLDAPVRGRAHRPASTTAAEAAKAAGDARRLSETERSEEHTSELQSRVDL